MSSRADWVSYHYYVGLLKISEDKVGRLISIFWRLWLIPFCSGDHYHLGGIVIVPSNLPTDLVPNLSIDNLHEKPVQSIVF